jgi:hypothetical protein
MLVSVALSSSLLMKEVCLLLAIDLGLDVVLVDVRCNSVSRVCHQAHGTENAVLLPAFLT